MRNYTTNGELLKRVKRGVRYLDKNRPGWAGDIDLGHFALESPSQCVIGQAFGEFYKGLEKLQPEIGNESQLLAWGRRHGFCCRQAIDGNGVYERMGLMWAQFIAVRTIPGKLRQSQEEARVR